MTELIIVMALMSADPATETQILVIDDAQVKLIEQVRVPAMEAGVLVKLDVKEGDVVKVDSPLGRIDDELIRVQQETAQFEHEVAKLESENDVDQRFAKKSREVAKSELTRSVESNAIYAASVSLTEIERLQLVVERSALSLEQSQRDMTLAKLTERIKDRALVAATKRAVRCRLTAPIDGMVVELFANRGEWLQPGDPVVRIVNLDRLRVEAHVDGKKYGKELQGCRVQFTVTLPPGDRQEEFVGRVSFVSPELQPVTGQARIWAEIENREMNLRPGDHGKLTITLPGKPQPE